jgi:5,10-methylenetetrahydrofolate reductase
MYASSRVRDRKPSRFSWLFFCVQLRATPALLSRSFSDDIMHLKRKVDAGADFVLCQFAYDAECYALYVSAAREAGVTVPIIPGVLPIYSVPLFQRLNTTAGVSAPPELLYELRYVRLRMWCLWQYIRICAYV